MVDTTHEDPEDRRTDGPGMYSVVVVTGAAPLSPGVVAALPAHRTVIAADGGLDYALEAGLEPQVLVGDLDSISGPTLAWARRHIEIEEHPSDKDQTDTELALRRAAGLHPDRLILLAGGGDRLDHTLAALGALGAEHLTSIPWLECWWAEQYALILHGPARAGLGVAPGTRISLLALHGRVDGITLRNTRWELRDAALAPMSGTGVSNEVIASPVLIEVTSGIATLFVEAPAHPVPFEPELPIDTAPIDPVPVEPELPIDSKHHNDKDEHTS
jgi:thiamine pyrophosphokinase